MILKILQLMKLVTYEGDIFFHNNTTYQSMPLW